MDDWKFPNRIKKAGTKMKPGPMWHEDLLGRVIQTVAENSGYRTSHGGFCGTGERRRWWRLKCRSKQRRNG